MQHVPGLLVFFPYGAHPDVMGFGVVLAIFHPKKGFLAEFSSKQLLKAPEQGSPGVRQGQGRELEQALAAGSNDLRAVHRAFLEGKGEAELAPLMMRQARSIELFSQVPASNDDDDDDELEVIEAPAAGTYLRSISYDANGKVETHSLPDSRVLPTKSVPLPSSSLSVVKRAASANSWSHK